jgi:uncharacterized protein (UPF0332 family)
MGERVSPELRRLLDEERITRFHASPEMVDKEVESARYDLGKAEESLSRGDAKWATVQGYYAFFHAVKALVYREGFREKSHRALLTALEELYVKRGKVPRRYLDSFRSAMNLREAADYGMAYSEEGARNIVSGARRFIEVVDKTISSHV